MLDDTGCMDVGIRHRVETRGEGHVFRRIADASIPGKRRRGRQKIRWKDSGNNMNVESVELSGGHNGQDKVE